MEAPILALQAGADQHITAEHNAAFDEHRQATQSPSANIGRYTLMGDLNPYPYPGFPRSGDGLLAATHSDRTRGPVLPRAYPL